MQLSSNDFIGNKTLFDPSDINNLLFQVSFIVKFIFKIIFNIFSLLRTVQNLDIIHRLKVKKLVSMVPYESYL